MAVSPGVLSLSENPDPEFLDAAKLLITYADNILRYPNEDKYKSIRIGNAKFSTKLLPTKGAVECLFEMGFEEGDTHLVFPSSASVHQLRRIRESIAAEKDQRLGRPSSQHPPPTTTTSTASTAVSAATPSLPSTPAPSAESPLVGSMGFFLTLQSNYQHVMVYESLELQQTARSKLPYEELSAAAVEKLNVAKASDPECKLGKEDFLVMELLRWFKKEFFSWVNCLPCSQCGGETKTAGSLNPSAEDTRWGAQRVESHYCQSCHVATRFPRYNNPEKLLETRRGRCGEWANCFTLCCRAVGLEARYIWDSTDHVWTEVYSSAQRRWLHCDPCENSCDKPLMYEVGWGKKLSYILAFSKDEVVDVTWRYSCNHPDVLTRRTKVQEAWLLRTISGLNVTRQQGVGPERKRELVNRLLVELVEFISPKKPKAGDLGGRGSGSLAWRIARGEVGAREAVPQVQYKFKRGQTLKYIFVESKWHKNSNIYNVTRSAAAQINIWTVIKVYIARTEGSPCGTLSWRFDCADAGVKMKAVSVTTHSQTFNSGTVVWRVRSGQAISEFLGDGSLQSFPLSGSTELVIEAELCGGEGALSWQHAQLFRQSLTETAEPSIEILLHL
ncbi:LOW QUALITY PROTEIN: peptide-N(4)-(N-acetyl-beta-glucosaminyl)asparagine amidase [Gadus chalcogrammus]|uniref:LOW QUALITY PROTEIN: peptide-N(4)-(N-acetyl-beta-glucosaminyl)asparagine amidase n=1 Tax=Gadus chalcogrammus TaxID=1042646 RepID=UPI0024C48391|nr:LOW QUALITY PROTEIN: peptide-N(4)-(N-acetyl-beta-glucosaminyl)asparagine amidase [Gadus chalcogrammus]